MQLSKLHSGQVGEITRLGDHPVANKLLEMGCLPGELIRVKRIAPLGDPIAVEVLGYELALRKDEAEAIEVELRPNFVQL
ncbi:MAG: ferrous iron transport protein A [Bacteroidia bacterium]